MNIKLRFAVIYVLLSLNLSLSAQASNSDDSSHLRIFTPQHKVIGVFNTEKYSKESKESKPAYVYLKDNLSQEELNLIANVVYKESKGEPFEGKVAVASVILNRLYHPDFPKTVKEVIYQKNAFSCVEDISDTTSTDSESVDAVYEALNGNDPTENALYFYNPKTAYSKWMKSISKNNEITIGNHVFFK